MTYTDKKAAKISQRTQSKHTDKQVTFTVNAKTSFIFIPSNMNDFHSAVCVQFQNNPATSLFETNYMLFANIELVRLFILTSGQKRVCFYIIYMFFK